MRGGGGGDVRGGGRRVDWVRGGTSGAGSAVAGLEMLVPDVFVDGFEETGGNVKALGRVEDKGLIRGLCLDL